MNLLIWKYEQFPFDVENTNVFVERLQKHILVLCLISLCEYWNKHVTATHAHEFYYLLH